ncbi:DUF2958 domain-containing protein [Bradyrhizobium sp. 62]|uniref:DUF2958 domain-containing protein n=1 Tax=Bradyrhizobium sp. 62 TaxID=1043588 RepID=UPI001FFA0547|nr:DUF2958 domain-containing protein [Bradyrhizobium sp. 62]MCK1367670.1 DUF2958 domain-containing protein [Bradyrhizobium sp. 62]
MVQNDFLTVEERVSLLVNALADERDHFPVLKLFLPDGAATWLITECDPDEPNRLFGLCDLGLGFPELGSVSLEDILSVRGKLGLTVERDVHFKAEKPISAYATEARAKGRIVA